MLRSYTAADLLTIGNAACGTIAIFLCLDYVASGERRFLWSAFVLLPAALACDVSDGYVARLNRARQSRLGADLDSLADVISFGVAPAILGFTLGLRGGWDMLLLTYFVVCGVSRLARFNVTAEALADADTGKVKYFEGTPHSDEHCPCDGARNRVLRRSCRRRPVVWLHATRSGDPAPTLAHVRRERQRDDQRHAAHPQALTAQARP